jgi:hypothetical protein
MRRALSAVKRPDVRKIVAAVRRADVRTALAAVRKPDMRRALTAVRNFYGASPLHLLALIGCFALAGYAAAQTLANPQWPVMLAWFAAAVIGHDLVVFPLYALADRSITGALRAVRPRGTTTPPLVPAVNHVRVPALGTGLLFLVFFPGIIQQGRQTYQAATGRTQEPYLGRWLLLVAAMFAISAVIYAIRLGRVLHRDRRPSPRK